MIVWGVTIYTLPYLKCQDGNESMYPWVRCELDNWDQYQVVRQAGEGHLHPSLLNQQYLSYTHNHTYTHTQSPAQVTKLRPHKNAHYSELNLPPFYSWIKHFVITISAIFYKVTTPNSVFAPMLFILSPSSLPPALFSASFSVQFYRISPLFFPFLLSVISVETVICSV